MRKLRNVQCSAVPLRIPYIRVEIRATPARISELILFCDPSSFRLHFKFRRFVVYSDTSANEDNLFRNHVR